jgi:signal transduction histidine kinase
VKNGHGAVLQHSPSDRLCEITVEDQGIGFEKKYLDRIFAPFQRLHGRGEYEGSGIGLAICRKIVERHGGTITALSTPGQGASFIVTLPYRQAKGEPRHA